MAWTAVKTGLNLTFAEGDCGFPLHPLVCLVGFFPLPNRPHGTEALFVAFTVFADGAADIRVGREHCSHVQERSFTVHRSRYRVHGAVLMEQCAGPGSGHVEGSGFF